LVADVRLPYFKLPEWVEDPFGGLKNPTSSSDDDDALNGRYEVRSSLAFSNSGGVYVAWDRQTAKTVVLKEARPRTNLWPREDGSCYDAVDVLRNEYAVMQRLRHLPFAVKAVDLFEEWEHTFLVEEHVVGISLSSYRARDEFHLLPFQRDPERLWRFCQRFKSIAEFLIESLHAIHQAGVVLGDVSPNNIMVNPDTMELHFIDLENAVHVDTEESFKRLSSLWATPGFRKGRQNGSRSQVCPEDDYFALGMTLFSLILPVNVLFTLEPDAENRIMEKVRECVDLPVEVTDCISALREGASERARQILRGWNLAESVPDKARVERCWRVAPEELSFVIRRLAEFIVATSDPSRQDRLWPGDIRQFQTNSMNVAYGACGVALFLRRIYGTLPPEIEDWMRKQPLNSKEYPPGLFPGLAGIAYSFAQLGDLGRGVEALEESRRSPLVFAETNWFEGASGWGWVNLFFYRRLQEEKFLEQAVEAGEKILASAETTSGGSFWTRKADNKIHYGMAYGATGVAHFLLHLFCATREERFLAAARRGLQFEMANSREQFAGIAWPRWEQDNLILPYWFYGSAGVASVLSRFFVELGDSEDLRTAHLAAAGAFTRFTLQTDQFNGLSGIGEAMLDMYLASGKEAYLARAHDIADSLLRFRIERPEGLAFPGRLLLRISNDFGTGGAGVGLFLERLLNPGPRLFHDFEASCEKPPLPLSPGVIEQA
jgi:serine/threonine protein kinase